MFSENLRKIRKEKGISCEELAKKAGTTRQTISNIELKKRGTSFEIGMKIAKALGVTAEELAYGKQED